MGDYGSTLYMRKCTYGLQ